MRRPSPTRSRATAGFTLMEVLVVVSLMLPLMYTILMSTRMVNDTLNASEREADVAEIAQQIRDRICKLGRPGALSTCRVRATQADVDAYQAKADAKLALDPLATPFVPAVGDWIWPTENDPRSNIQFRAALGTMAFNAQSLTPPRTIELVIDGNETKNGADDDGDGMIDEGMLILWLGTERRVVVDGVEEFSFELQGTTWVMRLRCARLDRQGRVHRQLVTQRITMRNK